MADGRAGRARGRDAGLSRTHSITAVLVSWKDAGETLRAVESLAKARALVAPGGPRVSLVVVDNDGGAVDRDALVARWPDATLLVNEENRGFGPAVNQAARVVAPVAAVADAGEGILLLVNPDARAVGEPFGEIARAFDENPQAVAVAPRLVDDAAATGRLAAPDREDQFTFQLRRLPRLSDDARELLLLDHLVPDNRWRRRARYAGRDPDAPLEVEQPAAAALAVRSAVFRSVGGFDERFEPAWFEDVDLCARLLERGTIVYWPAAKFRHRGGAASGELGYSRFLPIYYRNAIRYRRKKYSLSARATYRALLAIGMMLRLAALPLRRTPRPRGEAARAYLRTLALVLGRAR